MDDIERWKLTNLIKSLDSAKGSGTSVVTLILAPGEQVSKFADLLTQELGTAENIKSRVNRQSVQSAIVSVQQKLKAYHDVPKHGLVIFSGTVMMNGREKKITVDIEPPRPLKSSGYKCDDHFHTECLSELLSDDIKYGYIIVDGKGCLYGTLQGKDRTTLKFIQIEPQTKHNKGGQSSNRFARIRKGKEEAYLTKVCEAATPLFITKDMPNVAGIVMAGNASFKQRMLECRYFDARLAKIVMRPLLDVAYGGENGFSEAIVKSVEHLQTSKLSGERDILSAFSTHLAKSDGLASYGILATVECLKAGAVDTLIVWDHLPNQCTIDEKDNMTIAKPDDKLDSVSVLEWIVNNYKRFGARLVMVSDCTGEGKMFVGMGGIGGMLRYACDPVVEDADDDDDAEFGL